MSLLIDIAAVIAIGVVLIGLTAAVAGAFVMAWQICQLAARKARSILREVYFS